MPFRSRSRSNPGSSQYAVLTWSKPSNPPSYSGPFLVSARTESMWDVVTPNFSKRKKAGEIIINPCSYALTERGGSADGSVNAHKNDNSADWSLSGPVTQAYLALGYPTIPSSTVSDSSLLHRSRLQALAGIDKPALESGEDLLELRETIELLKNPLKGLLTNLKRVDRAWNAYNRRNTKKVLALSTFLADNWLQYRFAFSPLVRSVHGLLAEIQSPTKSPPDIRRSHGRGSDLFKYAGNLPVGSLTYNCSRSIQTDYHSVIIYRIKKRSDNWQWRYGLRTKDMPKNFWAVVPLSFMVDRVVDLSSMISAATNLADPSVEMLGASTVRKRIQKDRITLVSDSNPDYTTSISGNNMDYTTVTYDRSLWSPSLIDTLPTVKPMGLVSSAENVADLVTLVFSYLRKRL